MDFVTQKEVTMGHETQTVESMDLGIEKVLGMALGIP